MVSGKLSQAENNNFEIELSAPKKPNISVILPVYNGQEYIVEAIDSILKQTITDFELIVIDDGSTDGSLNLIKMYDDERIRIFTQENHGLAATLNRGIEVARGKYIARQDQDDLSFPERLEKQVKYLDSHPDCAMVGTWAEIWVGKEKSKRALRHPADNITLKYELLFNNPFVHSSIMLRKTVIDRVGGYSTDENRQPPEDYEFWSRISRWYEVSNIPEILLAYREVQHSMSRSGVSPFLNHLVTISSENIAWASSTPSNDPSPVNIAALIHNASHRLIGMPDVLSMSAILQKAVARVSQNNAKLERKASYQVEDIKYAYWRTKHSGIMHTLIYYMLKSKSKLLRMVRN